MSFIHVAVAQQPGQTPAGAGPATSPASKAPTSSAPKPAPSSPSAGSTTAPEAAHAPASSGSAGKKSPPAQPLKKVDLNNATIEQLKTLPTVGDAEAKKIIEHRPYKSKGELVTKAGLPEGVYHAVRNRVELQKPRKAAPKK
jgi:competence protein ComEA